MALIDEIPVIGPRLMQIPGVLRVTNGYPEDWATLPCISISEASNMPVVRYGNKEYITELEYDIRVWAASAAEIASIASQADDAMTGLGYERMMTYDDDSAEVRQKALRYRKNL